MTARDHGYARYKLDGCRCYICGWAVARYSDAREQAMRRGTWQPFTDAAPVRAHILALRECQLGTRRIAALAGCDRKRITAIVGGRPERGTGPQDQVRPALAAAILAIEPTLDNLGAATVIDATGTRRRLQALVAGGWPQAHLAGGLGMSPGNFGMTMGGPRVVVGTARAVRDLYDRWWRTDPTEHGASPGGVTRARRHAAANGWAPVGAWDDDTIDDPAAQPDLGARVLRQDAMVEDAAWLEEQGFTRQQAAGRLGVTPKAISLARRRARQSQTAGATP